MTWRLLVDPAEDGATNMAADTAALEAVASGDAPPTLRLYAWSPPCLSLGALQPVEQTLAQPQGTPGRDWVRRPSGGRALLHDRELTYAVIAPADDPLVTGGVGPAYRRIAEALAVGLELLGVPDLAVAAQRRREPRSWSPACYETTTAYELTARGRKLVGSAQLRRHGAVLQHGSIPLTLDHRALADRLAITDPDKVVAALGRAAVALDELIHPLPSFESLCAAVVSGFERVVGPLSPGALTARERERLPALSDLYRSPAWCRRR